MEFTIPKEKGPWIMHTIVDEKCTRCGEEFEEAPRGFLYVKGDMRMYSRPSAKVEPCRSNP